MSKKTFKSGLDSLIGDSIKDMGDMVQRQEKKDVEVDETSPEEKEKLDWLIEKMHRLSLELKKWRTGELSVDLFHESLKNFNLKYNPETNGFEKTA